MQNSILYITTIFQEFAKSRAKRAYVPTYLRASVVYLPTCLRASAVYLPTCLRANFSFLHADAPYGVPMFQLGMPTWQTACQYFNLACQRAKRHVDFSNIPLTKCYWKFLYFIIIKKFYIICDIIVISGIYPSNFDVHYATKKTQSFN